MKNIDIKLSGNFLIITMDLLQEWGVSRSGKSITIATTKGNWSVPGKEYITVNVNVYKPRPDGRTQGRLWQMERD